MIRGSVGATGEICFMSGRLQSKTPPSATGASFFRNQRFLNPRSFIMLQMLHILRPFLALCLLAGAATPATGFTERDAHRTLIGENCGD